MFNKSTTEQIKDAGKDIAHDVAATVENAYDRTKDVASNIADKVEDKFDNSKSKATVERLAEKGSEMLNDGARKAQQYADIAAEKASAYKNQAEQYVNKKPMQSVAIAAGVGAALAGLTMMAARSKKTTRTY